jgi:catechol 2,3-dioxygenase-like lactoylglutathione lyase family enzyme
MRAIRLNHVSIVADDLEESARFYEQLLGAERIPTPTFPDPVQWLRIGEQQLHLFLSPGNEPTARHHFGLDVDDFDGVYRRAKERGILDGVTFGASLRGHPTGWVHMYMRDPAGNLVECCWPDATVLDQATLADLVELQSQVRQEGDAAVATLYHS